MAKFIESSNVSEAWLRAMLALENEGGETTNLIVCLRPPVFEYPAITTALDNLLLSNPNVVSISKIAGTIFPWEFYSPDRPGADARHHLYENHRLARIIEDRSNSKRNYFDRMVRWCGHDGREINQLEKKICYYRRVIERHHRACNSFEITLAAPLSSDETEDVLIYDPEKSGSPYGFPCLSHISMSLSKNKLYMTATYRNQYFLQKAYGNYIGLLRLLNFLAREIDVEVGELVCVSTHADDESGDSTWFKRSTVKQLLVECQNLLQTTPSKPLELSYIRPTMGPNRISTAV